MGSVIVHKPERAMKDIGKAFSFMFEDPSWVLKVIIAALFMLLSLVGLGVFVLLGYFIEMTQRTMRGEPVPMPEWKDVGVKFILGFKYFVALMVYVLPFIFLFVPLVVLSALASFSESSPAVSTFVAIYTFGFMILMIPYIVLLMVLTPIITYRFALRERISDALDIGGVLGDFRRNWQNTVVVALITVGIKSFAGIGILGFFVGIFFTLFYAFAAAAYLMGALYRSVQEGVVEQ